MKKRVIISVIVCIALAVILPALLKANSAKKNDLYDFTTTINGSLSIELDENPSTGYSWHVTISNPEILKIVKDDYTQKGDLLGSGGIHKWEIKGIKEGLTTVKFELYRNWEPSNIIETKSYLVIVLRTKSG